MKGNLWSICLFAILFLVASSAPISDNLFSTPIASQANNSTITFTSVWPAIDSLLKDNYWYYLRGAVITYQASVDTANQFLFFVIYRNLVGTFLVITTWDKQGQTTQVNTFVRLGNGFQNGAGALYDPVKISPFVVTLQLQPD